MPGSVRHGKEEIKKFVQAQADIKSIVDVGAGSGTYRKLLGMNYHWTAIEIFEPYIEKFKLSYLYDDILIGDISSIVMPKADCVIFGDILEHLIKDQAIDVIRKALFHYKHVIISIPIGHYPAEIHYGNTHEAHISEWGVEDIKSLAAWEETYLIKQIGIFCK